ncbi:MAG: hypothetical protein JRE73_16290 [Deltaproteobacteria bacterium]|nr:hypothetical protein [Deltaproteobacteria bacterium]
MSSPAQKVSPDRFDEAVGQLDAQTVANLRAVEEDPGGIAFDSKVEGGISRISHVVASLYLNRRMA